MKKVIIYGDSIMRGVTYSAERGAHTLCRGHKLERVSALGLDVKNYARMGATIDKGIDMLDRTIDECDANTAVIFEFGGNDCDYDWRQVSQDPTASHRPNTEEKDFMEKYLSAIRRIEETGAEIIISTLIPVDSEKYIEWITKNNSYDNILGWLGDVSMLHRWQERYNKMVEEIARSTHHKLLDVREKFLLSHDFKSLISPDGIHPTDTGHDLIEGELCSLLKNYVSVSA